MSKPHPALCNVHFSPFKPEPESCEKCRSQPDALDLVTQSEPNQQGSGAFVPPALDLLAAEQVVEEARVRLKNLADLIIACKNVGMIVTEDMFLPERNKAAQAYFRQYQGALQEYADAVEALEAL